jgi:Ni,Fe-hydrogenase III component G
MKKIGIELEYLLEEIRRFYDAKAWHFLTVNGIDLCDGHIELQWLFSKYGARDEIVCFSAVSDFDTEIPSLVSLIPSAVMGERELVDMFGVKVEGAEKGLYLDEDSQTMPLRCSL